MTADPTTLLRAAAEKARRSGAPRTAAYLTMVRSVCWADAEYASYSQDVRIALAVARELLGETGASDPEPATAPRSDEQAAQDVVGPKRRLRSCVEAWPECQEGDYHRNCCRFPKSCSATIYDERYVTEDDLEPPVSQPGAERAAEGREA